MLAFRLYSYYHKGIQYIRALNYSKVGRVMAVVREEGYSPVGSMRELQASGKRRVTVNERTLVIVYARGEVYALDHFCYRK